MSVSMQSIPVPAAPWWRVSMVWLVIGGPAAVIVASFVTLALAISHPDPLVSDTARQAADEPADLRSMDVARTPQATSSSNPALLPALQARNHAATGGR